jgi:hypothetical protein
MDIEKLKAKLNQFRASAELKLEDANKAIEADDFVKAEELQGEADELMAKAASVQKQIEQAVTVKGLKVEEPEPESTPEPDPVRPPFEEDEPVTKAVEEDEMTAANAVNVLRYGEGDAAVKAVMKDLYSGDYNQKRTDQMDVFTKFLRFGEGRLTAADVGLLNTVLLQPGAIKAEISSGRSVGEIKATLQEMVNDLGGCGKHQVIPSMSI